MQLRSHLPDVIKIAMWDAFELFELGHFIEHLVQVELRAQEVQPSVAVRLSGTRGTDRQADESIWWFLFKKVRSAFLAEAS